MRRARRLLADAAARCWLLLLCCVLLLMLLCAAAAAAACYCCCCCCCCQCSTAGRGAAGLFTTVGPDMWGRGSDEGNIATANICLADGPLSILFIAAL